MKIYLSILVIILSHLSWGQNAIDAVLSSVEKNNKTIITQKQLMTAKQLSHNTGITPDNPFVSADYMIGRPVSGGNQLDFLATQHLEFPTVYSKRKKLSKAHGKSTSLEFEKVRQEVLLEAKLACLELIYLNKLSAEIRTRIDRTDSLVNQFEHKFENADISALDVNKAKIQLLNLKAKLRDTESQLNIQKDRLTAMNGGITIDFDVQDYNRNLSIPEFETLRDTVTKRDLQLQSLHQDMAIYKANIELSKAVRLPEIEFGYHYQSVLGQTFNGAHLGLSIPLWQHKNKVKAAHSFNDFGTHQIESYDLVLQYELRKSYDRFENQKQTLQEYEEVLTSINSEKILNRLLELGDIDFITYAQEMEYFYEAKDNFLLLQKELQSTHAELFKYQL